MTEIIFVVEEAAEGGYIARAWASPFLQKPIAWKTCTKTRATRSCATSMKAKRRE